MRPDFTQFPYGFAHTEALVDGRQHLVWPTFPTQPEERRAGYPRCSKKWKAELHRETVPRKSQLSTS